jgi:hypothetical protein
MDKVYFLSLLLGAAMPLAAFRGGAPLRSTSAPGDSTCNQCHGRALNSGGGSLRIEPLEKTYEPGKPLRVRVTLSDPRARAWGFHLTARTGPEDQAVAGRFESVPGDLSTQSLSRGETITHTYDGAAARQAPEAAWEVIWIPPADAPEFVTFYASGNAANGDGDNWGDDQIYTSARRVARLGSAESRGWLLETDPPIDGAARRVRFWNEGGAQTEVTLDGATVQLSPWRLAEWAWEGLNSWIDVDLPEGVQAEAVWQAPGLGRRVQRALRKSAGPRSLAIDPDCRAEILNLSTAEERFVLTRRTAEEQGISEETLTAPPRSSLEWTGPPGLIWVRAVRAGAPYALHERCSVEK